MDQIAFIKMHGLGNDFVIIDARDKPFTLGESAARRIADRRRGVGCDQVIVLGKPKSRAARAFMTIRNADGGASAACGNATRCVAALLMSESGEAEAIIETEAGVLVGTGDADGVTVDMGEPRLKWNEVPLADRADTLNLDLGVNAPAPAVACSMGNPHATFFLGDLSIVDIAAIGPILEHHEMFPERANIGFAQVLERDHVRLRVWERGAGLTPACATGSCAAVVGGVRRKLLDRRVRCTLDGGELTVTWREEDNHVLMTGPVSASFTGLLNPSLVSE